MDQLLVATRNPGKKAELEALLGDIPYELVSLSDLAIHEQVDEAGDSYQDNARLKAIGYGQLAELPALADDSGIEAEALDWGPGVRSARFGGAELDDDARNQYLRQAIEASGRGSRRLRFRCVMVLAVGGREVAMTEGSLDGELAPRAVGANGFGYDPIFLLPSRGVTTAELPPADKHAISHRGQAARAMAALLRDGILP